VPGVLGRSNFLAHSGTCPEFDAIKGTRHYINPPPGIHLPLNTNLKALVKGLDIEDFGIHLKF